jgi:ankyrin repeat protein
MLNAAYSGDAQAIVRLVAGGEDVNCVVAESGSTPVLIVLARGHGFDDVKALIDIGADLSIVANNGGNVLHGAVRGGNIECIDYMLDNTTLDIDSTTTNGTTSLMFSLRDGHYEASKFLVEMGANLFSKIDDGTGRRAIELPVITEPVIFGPRILSHFKNIKWQSDNQLLLLYTAYDSPILMNEGHAQVRSAHLASRVLASPDLIRVIASYFIPSKIITRDKSIEVRDAVRERVEVQLAGFNVD